jgi:hypothetical protein
MRGRYDIENRVADDFEGDGCDLLQIIGHYFGLETPKKITKILSQKSL